MEGASENLPFVTLFLGGAIVAAALLRRSLTSVRAGRIV